MSKLVSWLLTLGSWLMSFVLLVSVIGIWVSSEYEIAVKFFLTGAWMFLSGLLITLGQGLCNAIRDMEK